MTSDFWYPSSAALPQCGSDYVYARGQSLTSAQYSDFGYLVTCDRGCDDAEDSFWEVLGGES